MKLVETGREERATRVETTRHPKNTPGHKTADILTMVSTRPARYRSQVGSTSFREGKSAVAMAMWGS